MHLIERLMLCINMICGVLTERIYGQYGVKYSGVHPNVAMTVDI